MISWYEEAISRLSLQEVAERYGLKFNRAGFAVCPFHSERTASFKIKNERFGHCFGCGVNATAVSLAAQLLGLSRQDALRRLNEDFALGLPLDRKSSLRERAQAERRMRERRQEKAHTERAQAVWDTTYHRLLQRWARCEKALRELRPASPREEPDDRWVQALHERDYLNYALDHLPERPGDGERGDRQSTR